MRLRWGIAGCGWVARDYVAPAVVQSTNGVLAALHDVSLPALERMADLFPDAKACETLADFFGGIDVVYVASPNTRIAYWSRRRRRLACRCCAKSRWQPT